MYRFGFSLTAIIAFIACLSSGVGLLPALLIAYAAALLWPVLAFGGALAGIVIVARALAGA